MPFLTFKTTNIRDIGPVIEVIAVPSQPVAELLRSENKPMPSIRCIALIDTGASTTCISQEIVDVLNLVPFDSQIVHTAGGESAQMFYDVGVILPIAATNVIVVQAPCADLSKQPYQMLIGRDILAGCTLFYHGPENQFTIHI